VICWDSGGGSFQITAQAETGGSEVRAFCGRIGVSPVTQILCNEILMVDYASQPPLNPVSTAHARALVELLKGKLAPPPPWLVGSRSVVAIGGPNSLWSVGLMALHRDATRRAVLTRDDVSQMLASVVDKGDDELLHCVPAENNDPCRLVVPKIALLVAVAEHLSLPCIAFQPCIGSCAGVAVLPEFWQ
jgi:hypothetical protein